MVWFQTLLFFKGYWWQVPVTKSAVEQRLISERHLEYLLSICRTKVRTIVSTNSWKICFVAFGIQHFYHLLCSAAGAYWLLSTIHIGTKCSGDAWFVLQTSNISHGQEDFVYLLGTLFDAQYDP